MARPPFEGYIIRAMENLWDHKPTRSELEELFGDAPEETIRSFPRDEDTALGDIVRLYQVRGEDAKAEEYAARIEDALFREGLLSHDVLFDRSN